MDVAIIGAALTDFGERTAWIRDLAAEAADACLIVITAVIFTEGIERCCLSDS
jgi:acetyl-CoA acetyltransferase